MNEHLLAVVLDRLKTAGPPDDPALLVLAACDGPGVLETALGSKHTKTIEAQTAPKASSPVTAYLGALSVEGFRGIGPRATLPLTPGPGLTLVIGRNGSGKSSFAEGLEFLLTGDNSRWKDKVLVWREGWKNLHSTTSSIQLDLHVEGSRGGTAVTRTWKEGATIEGSTVVVQPHGKPKADLESLGWSEDLAMFRPFLSYSELGSMLDESPVKLHDALSAILGLGDLVEVEKVLKECRKARETLEKSVTSQLTRIRRLLDTVDDERAAAASVALKTKSNWNLDEVERSVHGSAESATEQGELDLLHKLKRLEIPATAQMESLAIGLRTAAGYAAGFKGTDAERADTTAGLLRQAMLFHKAHGNSDCPVCGRKDALDPDWRTRAEKEIEELDALAVGAERARTAIRQAIADARDALVGPPSFLLRGKDVGVDTRHLREAWAAWSKGTELSDPEALATHLESDREPLAAAADEMRQSAETALALREDVWRPIAQELAAWLPEAKVVQAQAEAVANLKKAEKWVKETAGDIRNERFEPIAETAQEVWSLLRLQSSVELQHIELTGAGPQRKVKLEVNVDGVDAAALGVMSQGELHSLALSLFLPRATLEESPFRFVVIDDPVQSMDPSRVDGLARVLDRVATDRQVIVFTHDDRLTEAVRRLGIEARVISVTRRADSVVELREETGPVNRYIEDALVLAKTDELPTGVAARLVPGFCRLAIEAACTDAIRRRRLGRGDPHRGVEELLGSLTTTTMFAATALFDDPDRGGDVMKRLNQFGGWAGDTFKAAKEGAHGAHAGTLVELVKNTASLANKLLELA